MVTHLAIYELFRLEANSPRTEQIMVAVALGKEKE
jgi:hypothetical protein